MACHLLGAPIARHQEVPERLADSVCISNDIVKVDSQQEVDHTLDSSSTCQLQYSRREVFPNNSIAPGSCI